MSVDETCDSEDRQLRALSFLGDVQDFSRRYLTSLGLPPDGSPNGSPGLQRHGIVLHYTVDDSAPSVLRWLCSNTSEASAHFVIAQTRLAPGLSPGDTGGYGQAHELPASIIQLRPLDCSAWHATWANKWSFGIELCNAGEIRNDAHGVNHIYRPGRGWVPSANPYVRHHIDAGSRSYCGYNDAQLYSLQLLLHALCQGYGIPVARIWGHDNVQGRATPHSGAHDKRDIGPAFDLAVIRHMVTSMSSYEFDTAYRQAYLVPSLATSFGTQGAFAAIHQECQDDWALRGLAKGGDQAAICQLFSELNYHVDTASDLSSIDKTQVLVFQNMMGLVPDGIIGPATRAALCLRHADRLGPAPLVATGDLNA